MGLRNLSLNHGSKLGRKANWIVRGIKVRVQLHDVKDIFGRIRFLISPVEGEGEKWVDISKTGLVKSGSHPILFLEHAVAP